MLCAGRDGQILIEMKLNEINKEIKFSCCKSPGKTVKYLHIRFCTKSRKRKPGGTRLFSCPPDFPVSREAAGKEPIVPAWMPTEGA